MRVYLLKRKGQLSKEKEMQGKQNKVSLYLVKPGQLGIIRVGIDGRSKKQLAGRGKLNSGIYALVEILDFPMMSRDVSDFYLNADGHEKEKLRVKIRYLKNLLNTPLLLSALKQNPIINQDQFLIDGFQRSTMPLKKEAFDELVNLLKLDGGIFSTVADENIDTVDEIAKLELKYQYATPEIREGLSKRIERGSISSAIKRLNNYKCQVCQSLNKDPYSFKKTNSEYYIETHHIVHVSTLLAGSLGFVNLITVCANHHRQFHYGNIEIVENTNDILVLKIDGEKIEIRKHRL